MRKGRRRKGGGGWKVKKKEFSTRNLSQTGKEQIELLSHDAIGRV